MPAELEQNIFQFQRNVMLVIRHYYLEIHFIFAALINSLVHFVG
jgi:hypothetical protein